MNEALRQNYLRLLDIQPVYLRAPVAGAAPSPVYEWPALPVGEGASALPKHGMPKPESSKRVSLKPVSSKPESSKRGTQDTSASSVSRQAARSKAGQVDASAVAATINKSETPVSPKVGAAPQPQVVFKLAWYPLGEGLAVIDEFPATQERPSQAAVDLLQNILGARALDVVPAEGLSQSKVHTWPMADTAPPPDLFAAAPPDPQKAAEDFIAAIIKSRLKKGPLTELLAFTDRLQPLVKAAVDKIIKTGKKDAPLTLTATHSLEAMLAQPGLKKQAWQVLQPLKKRLAG